MQPEISAYIKGRRLARVYRGYSGPGNSAQAVAVDLLKPLAEVQAQAQTMSVDTLKATVLKYKEAIAGKQADVETLLAKIKEIPITEALGQEAKTLKTDLQSLETTVSAFEGTLSGLLQHSEREGRRSVRPYPIEVNSGLGHA